MTGSLLDTAPTFTPSQPPLAPLTDFSERQIDALALVPFFTCPLSIIGSSLIIYMLLTRKDDRRETYRRLLLGLSACDIIHSFTFMISPLVAPKETGARLAMGTTATCSTAGFFNGYGISAVFYNAFLLLYFLLTIRYRVSEKLIATRIEPIFHAFCMLLPIVAGSVGVALEVFNPGTTFGVQHCFISPYPSNCLDEPDVECIRGGQAVVAFRWLLTVLPLAACNLFLYGALGAIYWTVRQKELESRRLFPHSSVQAVSYDVGVQSLLYAVCFVLTYLFLILYLVLATVEEDKASRYFGLLVLAVVFFPLQGFFNFYITIRPRFIRLRGQCTHKSFAWVLKESVFGAASVSETMSNPREQPYTRSDGATPSSRNSEPAPVEITT